MSGIDSYTKFLMMPLQGNGGGLFRNQISTKRPLKTYGNVQISAAQSKIGTSSGLFDGNGDYLKHTAFILGTSDFCLEAFVYLNAMPTSDAWPTNFNNHMVVVENGTASNSDGTALVIGATKLILVVNDSQLLSGTHGMTTGQWYHVAVSRSGTNFYLWVDGAQVATTTSSASMGTGQYTFVGCETGEGAYFNGYMEMVRVSIGTPRYTSGFTPTTTPFTVDEYTFMLLYMHSAFKTEVDCFGSWGGPVEDDSLQIFNTNTIHLNGTSAYLVNSILDNWCEFSTSDFTIDAWIYMTSTAYHTIAYFREFNATMGSLCFFPQRHADRVCVWVSSNSSSWDMLNGDDYATGRGKLPITTNEWHHVAFVRNGNYFMTFIDGRADCSCYSTAAIATNVGKHIFIGHLPDNGGVFFAGNIAFFRVSLGIARWTGCFEIPTKIYSELNDYKQFLKDQKRNRYDVDLLSLGR